MASLKKRGKSYYAQYYLNGLQVRRCLHTASLQGAKEKLRQLESSLYRGIDCVGPTRTPTPDVVTGYIIHIRSTKTKASVRVDIWYLRDIFGPICPELVRSSGRDRKDSPKPKRVGHQRIGAKYFEQISTQEISNIISYRIQNDKISPKTANRYREVLSRLFNWAMNEGRVRLPNNLNPAAKVERRRESAPEISFLSHNQIREQLHALEGNSALQTMVAVYIFAGLRREEALWLQHEDVALDSGENGMIRVRAKTVGGEFWEPKTKRNRAVPISTTLRRYLDAYEQRLVPAQWYFPSPKGQRWDCDNFSRALRVANRKVGLEWSCLDYRHTFGSHLAMKGESLYKIGTLMGNSPEVCRRHYAALLPEALSETVEFGMPSEPELKLLG